MQEKEPAYEHHTGSRTPDTAADEQFGADRADRFPAGELGGQMFAEVTDGAYRHRAGRAASGRRQRRAGGHAVEGGASEALREMLDSIAAAARVMR